MTKEQPNAEGEANLAPSLDFRTGHSSPGHSSPGQASNEATAGRPSPEEKTISAALDKQQPEPGSAPKHTHEKSEQRDIVRQPLPPASVDLGADQQAKKRREESQRLSRELWSYRFNGAMSVAAIAGIFLMWWTAVQTKQSVDLTRVAFETAGAETGAALRIAARNALIAEQSFEAAQRALITATPVVIRLTTDAKAKLAVRIDNVGPTPALGVRASAKCRFVTQGQPFDPSIEPSGGAVTVYPKMPMHSQCETDAVITEARMMALRSGAATLYVSGHIRYTDVFGSERSTLVCSALGTDLQPGFPPACDKYNHAK